MPKCKLLVHAVLLIITVEILFMMGFIALIEANFFESLPSCLTILGKVYEEECLRTGISSPYQLCIDYRTNTLFYSFLENTPETFKIAYLRLASREYDTVKGINGGFAIAVDRKSNIVYMGGEDGIYKYNYKTNRAINLHIISVNIWQMFYKDGLYFTTFPDEEVFVYYGDQTSAIPVPQLKKRVMVIAVKNGGDFVFSNSSGLFIYTKTLGKYSNIGGHIVTGFTSDIFGNIYFSTPNGIYYIDDKRYIVQTFAIFKNIYGVAMEENGSLIYANEYSLLRLKLTHEPCLDHMRIKNVIQV